jgi:hypothetical protein
LAGKYRLPKTVFSPLEETAMSRKLRIAALLFMIAVPAAKAQVIAPSPDLPPLNGMYITPGMTGVLYNGGGAFGSLILNNLQHLDFSSSTPPPLNNGQMTTDNFNSTVIANASLFSGPNGTGAFLGTSPINQSGVPVSVSVFKASGPNGSPLGTFNTEMLSLNLSTVTGFGPVMIRESPTLQSLGQTMISPDTGGLFHIDSFFDVFTELSVNGGNTWIPQTGGPCHVDLVPTPEPGSLILCGVGGMAFAAYRRRFGKRKTAADDTPTVA